MFEDIRYKLAKKKLSTKTTSVEQRKFISSFSAPLSHRLLCYWITNQDLNLKNPVTFNDKIRYMMLWVHGDKETELADKYLVRNYLKKKGLEKLAPKVYGVYNSVDEIDPKTLPSRFVLKCNHGCGKIQFCEQKKRFDFDSAKRALADALAEDYATFLLEPHYHNIKRKIICEEFLPCKSGSLPKDYKFYCYDGKVECVLVCSERAKKLRLDYYDLDWNYLPYAKPSYRLGKKIPKPKHLDEMVKIATKLSKGFPFVRVDLYDFDDGIRFSELTFTPAAGAVPYNTDEALTYLGSLIKLPPKKHEPSQVRLSY